MLGFDKDLDQAVHEGCHPQKPFQYSRQHHEAYNGRVYNLRKYRSVSSSTINRSLRLTSLTGHAVDSVASIIMTVDVSSLFLVEKVR